MCINKKTIALILALSLSPIPFSARASDGDDAGIKTGAVACSLVYTPLKAGIFLLMEITGALSYLGTIPAKRTDISQDWMQAGYEGDWYIRPAHLRGETAPKLAEFHSSSTETARAGH